MKANQTCTAEFRAEAVKLLLEQGLTQPGAARPPGSPKKSLSNRVVAARRSGGESVTPGAPAMVELRAENARLREKFARAEVQSERSRKKAAACFARES